jgi:uncharacterized membrane protein
MKTGVAAGGGKRASAGMFAGYHKADRNFFLLFLALCWLGVIMGFMPAVAKRAHGLADYPAPPILQLHAFVFTAWLVLLATQIALIRTRRPALHKLLGLSGMALIPVMAVSAFLSEVYSQRFYFAHPPNSQAFFILPIFYVIAFASLATAAMLCRKSGAAHKRLIVLATTIIVGAAYARWIGQRLTEAFGDGMVGMIVNTYTGTNLLMAGAVVYDLATRRRVHRVYKIAVPTILLAEIGTSFVYHSPGWLPIARLLIGR